MRALVVCQAGKGVGLGHLSRCLVIVESLRVRLGACVRLAIHGDRIPRPGLGAFQYEFIEQDASLSAWLGGVKGTDLVVLDLHPQRVPADLATALRALRIRGARVVAIDGLLSYRRDLDLVFIPSFTAQTDPQQGAGAPVVWGWDCLLIDQSLEAVMWQSGPRVLALTGGSDVTDLGQHWPALLNAQLPSGTELHWVTGPFARNPKFPDQPKITIWEHRAPQGLASLMQTMNYAVTVYGVSVFELLRFGIPTVVFSPFREKGATELKLVAEAGVALVATDEVDASKQLTELMCDTSLAARLSSRAKRSLPGSGGARFAAEVKRLLDGLGSCQHLTQ